MVTPNRHRKKTRVEEVDENLAESRGSTIVSWPPATDWLTDEYPESWIKVRTRLYRVCGYSERRCCVATSGEWGRKNAAAECYWFSQLLRVVFVAGPLHSTMPPLPIPSKIVTRIDRCTCLLRIHHADCSRHSCVISAFLLPISRGA